MQNIKNSESLSSSENKHHKRYRHKKSNCIYTNINTGAISPYYPGGQPFYPYTFPPYPINVFPPYYATNTFADCRLYNRSINDCIACIYAKGGSGYVARSVCL